MNCQPQHRSNGEREKWLEDVRPEDMSNLLHKFAELQSEKGIVPPIFDYDQNILELCGW
jgi:hypothetical protein